jgi:hypothetical protein
VVEALEQLSLPTRNEAQEIEISSRLYIENRTLFMTATIMVRAADPNPATSPVTFVVFLAAIGRAASPFFVADLPLSLASVAS